MSKSDHAIETHIPLTPVVLAILLALSHGDRHGYAIMKEAALPEGGGISLGPGTLYGTIDRLIRDALAEETGLTDDARRRYYRLTRLGHRVLAAEIARLRNFVHAASTAVVARGSRA
jgi:DNA-binding PadR family transcriptional regulator